MRILTVCFFACTLLLTGCNFEDIKDAVANIDNAAEKASVATSEEVHSIRAIEISYKNESFTVNDLYKGILRDVYWHYEKDGASDMLEIKGTWQPDLLSSYGLTLEDYPKLDVTGKVFVTLQVIEGVIQDEKTNVKVIYEDKELVNETGSTVLNALYDEYTK